MQKAARTAKAVHSTIYRVGHLVSWLMVVGILLTVVMVAALSIFSTQKAHAATNSTINFQARVLTASGSVIPDGNVNIQFKIYDASGGGNNPWTEDQTLPAKNGYVTASLGSVTPFPGTINWDQELWLTLNVNGDGEMGPTRMKITAVPYSFRSGQADVLTNGTGTISAAGLAQLSPSLVQSTSSINTAIRINQTGTGGLLQLQGDGGDVFAVAKSGQITSVAGITIGSSSTTTAGTLRWSGSDFEGYDGSGWVSLTSGGGSVVGGGGNLLTKVKVSNETVNNSATLQDDDELSFAIGVSETWTFRFVVQALSGTTPDLKFAVTAPSGASCYMAFADPEGATSNGQYGCGTATQSIAGNGQVDLYEVTGTIVNGATAGNVTLQWAQNAANASNTTVYAGSYLIASTTASAGGLEFLHGGNTFGETAVLGTDDNYGINLQTNGVSRLTISNSGAVGVVNDLTVGNALVITAGGATISSGGLTVSNGGISVAGDSTITGALTNLTGLEVDSGGATIVGGLDLDNDGIINAGSITGVGSNITANGSLTISSGSSADLTLSPASGLLIFDAATWSRTAIGETAISLNDSSDTVLRIMNSDATATAGLIVEGNITADTFSGSGASISLLNASNISSGTIEDTRLSSNVALLNLTQSFSELQTFSAGLTLGNTANTTAGNIRWTGADFEGYNGSAWVSLTSGGSGSATLLEGVMAFGKVAANGTALNIDGASVVRNSTGYYTVTLNSSASNSNYVVLLTVEEPASTMDDTKISIDNQSVSSFDVYIHEGDNGATADVLVDRVWHFTALDPDASAGGSSGAAFVQGGNSFGAVALLGTTDNYGINIVTNGSTALAIDSSGDATFNGGLIVSTELDVTGNVILSDDVTLGNESSDGLTIYGQNVVLPNGLNFDGGTFTIDASNDRVGIGNASPSNLLSINSPTTLDSSAQVLVATAGATNKGLVIQSASSQTANLLEIQNNLAQTLSYFDSGGQLVLGNDLASPTAGVITFNDNTASNGFTAVLGISNLSSSRTINLPDEGGTLCVQGSTNCGFVVIGPSSVQADSSTNNSVFINKTGASGDIINLQKDGNTVLSVVNSGALKINLTNANALAINNSSGTQYFNVDTSGAIVQIGGSSTDSLGVLLVLDNKNTTGDPSGLPGGMYYNSADNKFRCYENGIWKDCISEISVRSYLDSNTDAVVDANTTNYWDTGAENNNSYPNIALSQSSGKAVLGMVTMEVYSTSTADREVTARVERGVGSPPTCGSGTDVGGKPGTFSSNNPSQKSSTVTFLDTPDTTDTVYYTLCSDSNTVGTSGTTITRIRITLQEVNNNN